ncbi:transposase-like protein [Serratia sp. BIGb0234]|uniref:transposase n=1 Tax=Serratia sp. BIGb0234 TaxID=2940614 RepID=UPI002169387C|nr:transposase [Serratia sp. BIGb0234]MCS4320822.1 transposase-like protein [Serratia sp. BIGb0234]
MFHSPGAYIAQIARENGVNDNVIVKWLRLWQNGSSPAAGAKTQTEKRFFSCRSPL